MKSFIFSLEIVLEARRAQEAEAGHQLAMALEKERAATAREREATLALDRLLQVITVESADRFSAANRERSCGMRHAQEKICETLRKAVQQCAEFTTEKRAIVLQARRNRDLLERLKAARLEAWQKEAAHAEQHQFDEFAMTRRHQAAQQEHSLC